MVTRLLVSATPTVAKLLPALFADKLSVFAVPAKSAARIPTLKVLATEVLAAP